MRRTFISILLSALLLSGNLSPLPKAMATGEISASGPTLSLGDYHTCTLLETGEVKCWGSNMGGETQAPLGLGAVTEISADVYHTCALNSEGNAKCWGYDFSDQLLTVPSSIGKILHIAAGGYHNCAIKVDGLVSCWGEDFLGQTSLPADLGKVTQITAGRVHTCAITDQQLLRCWGYNSFGQSTVPSDLGQVSQVAVENESTCVITIQGSVRCWGANYYGQDEVPANLSYATQIAVGFYHSCAINSQGEAICWGDNTFGQTQVPTGLGKITQIAAGNAHTCAVNIERDVTCWGLNQYLQSQVPSGTGKVLGLAGTKLLPLPTISGATKVGQIVSVETAGFDSNASLNYQWLLDGQAIQGQTSVTYAIATTDYLRNLSVRVTATSNGLEVANSTSMEKQVLAGALTSTSVPEIFGESVIGKKIYARTGSWDDGTAFSYQWLRDGQPIDSGSSNEHTFDLADLDASLSVEVTGSKLGYTSRTLESEPLVQSTFRLPSSPCSAQVQMYGQLDLANNRPAITGLPNFEQTLKGVVGSFPSGTKVCSFWMRGNEVIPLARSSTYRLQGLDVGENLRFVSVGTKNNISTVRLSNAVRVEKAGFSKAKSPTVRGLARVGSMLSATTSTWASGVESNFQWLRDGDAIQGATSKTYTPSFQDLGKSLSFRVCGTKMYYQTTCLDSPTQIIQLGVISKVGSLSIVGRATNPGSLVAGVSTQWMSGVNLQSQWLLNGTPIEGATSPQIVIQPSYRGGILAYQVVGSQPGYASITKISSGKRIP